MKRIAGITLTAAMLLSAVTGCTALTDQAATDPSESEVTDLGPARPQDDFYRYVNQETLDNAEFEYGSVVAGQAFRSEMINDQLEGIVGDVIAGSGYEAGSEEDIIKTA